MKIVVVGFKVAEANSVYYKKIDIGQERAKENKRMQKLMQTTIQTAPMHIQTPQERGDKFLRSVIGTPLQEAFAKGAEFVSVRFIKEAGE